MTKRVYRKFPSAADFTPGEIFVHEGSQSLYIGATKWSDGPELQTGAKSKDHGEVVILMGMHGGYPDDVAVATAEKVVQSYNAFDALVAACQLVKQSNMIGTNEPSLTISKAAWDAITEALNKAAE